MTVVGYGFDPTVAQMRMNANERTGGIPGVAPVQRPDVPEVSGVPGVGERFEDFVRQVNADQHQAERAQVDFANGQTDDIHGVMLTMQKADIQFRLLSNIRNKVIEAYREVMRMGA